MRGEVTTNTVEGYFSILKRGITGTYHHVSSAHLKRYLAEFDFRYNERASMNVSDDERAVKAIQGRKASASPIGGLTQIRTAEQAVRFLLRKPKKKRQTP